MYMSTILRVAHTVVCVFPHNRNEKNEILCLGHITWNVNEIFNRLVTLHLHVT